MDASTIALLIAAVAVVLFATELLPLSITAVLASLTMAFCGVITFPQAFSGFSNDTTMFVLGMSVVANSLFETGAAMIVGRWFIRNFRGSERSLLLVIMLVTAVLSAFVSNTATVLLFMSVIAAMGAGSGGKITKKNTYMAIGFASVVGGGCTLIGSTPQLVAQGLLIEMDLPRLKFFTLAFVGFPMLVAILLYYRFFAYKFQQRLFANRVDMQEADMAHDDETIADNEDVNGRNLHTWLPVIILVVCVGSVVAGVAPPGGIAMLGACACVVLKCITAKRLFATVDWNTIFVLGGVLGFAKGIEISGAAGVVAEFVVGILGEGFSPFLFFTLIVFAVIVMTNFMSNTAAVIIFIPIAVKIALQMDINVMPVVVGIIWAAQCAFASPIGTAPVTMTLVAGYHFKDYLRVGGLFNLVAFLIIIIFVPLLMPL